MGHLPAFTHPDHAESAAGRHYHDLLEQSATARVNGDHRAAQQLASAAHKWAMDELARVQRLAHAHAQLLAATKQLEKAWDRDRSCSTVAELRERHPEFRRVITDFESATELVRGLSEGVPASPSDPDDPSRRRRSVRHTAST